MDIPISHGLVLKAFDDRDDFPECGLVFLEVFGRPAGRLFGKHRPIGSTHHIDLSNGHKFTKSEEDAIASSIGKLRYSLGRWRTSTKKSISN